MGKWSFTYWHLFTHLGGPTERGLWNPDILRFLIQNKEVYILVVFIIHIYIIIYGNIYQTRKKVLSIFQFKSKGVSKVNF